MPRKTTYLSLAGSLLLAGTVHAGDGCGSACTATASKNAPAVALAAMSDRQTDIVDTAISAGSFKTLAAALQAAGLVDALKGDGPFTVFAPTDEAFAKLPAGTVESLLKPENKPLLTAILTYHVVAGEVMAADVSGLTSAKTLNGQRIDVSLRDGVRIDDAKVVKADIACTNGVIHVIDRVIMPATDNLVATAVKAGSFETLAAAVKAAGLAHALAEKGPYTVLAPTDAAFAKLPAGTIESLLEPANREKLAAILKFHVIPGRVYAADALSAQTATTLEGSRVRFGLAGGSITVNGANVVQADLETSNGVIHVIDAVILPG